MYAGKAADSYPASDTEEIEIADYVPSLTMDELKQLEAEIMQVA